MQTSSTLTKILAAVTLSLIGAAAHAATPQEIVKLPRVVITGKASPVIARQEVVQLPRVVVVGYSQKTLEQRELLAANGAGKTLRARNG